MSDFIIATVSSCDLPKEYLQEHNIELLCYPYSIGGEDCLDDCDQDKQNAVYKRMRAGEFVDTSMINEYAYEEFFERGSYIPDEVSKFMAFYSTVDRKQARTKVYCIGNSIPF